MIPIGKYSLVVMLVSFMLVCSQTKIYLFFPDYQLGCEQDMLVQKYESDCEDGICFRLLQRLC